MCIFIKIMFYIIAPLFTHQPDLVIVITKGWEYFLWFGKYAKTVSDQWILWSVRHLTGQGQEQDK